DIGASVTSAPGSASRRPAAIAEAAAEAVRLPLNSCGATRMRISREGLTEDICSTMLRLTERLFEGGPGMARRIRIRTITLPRLTSCPECGGPLIHDEGCHTCPLCGYSACG